MEIMREGLKSLGDGLWLFIGAMTILLIVVISAWILELSFWKRKARDLQKEIERLRNRLRDGQKTG